MRYLLLLFFLLPLVGITQNDTTLTEEPVQLFPSPKEQVNDAHTAPSRRAPVAMRTIPQDRWAEASKDLDYSKDLPKPPKEEKPRNFNFNPNFLNWTAATAGLGTILQVLAIILATGLIGYAIYRMLQVPRNRAIARDGVEITVDNIDQYIHETDLDRFLREALAQGNFPLVIRLYYLQIIKELSSKNAIRWAREKTNRDYQREMRQHRLAEPFRVATLRYEEVWYGNQPLSAGAYALLEPDFKQLLGKLAEIK